MREHASEPRDYEMMIVITPTVGEEGLPAEIERVSGYITGQGGTVSSTINENPWGRRRLAYPINDHRDAFYVLYRFIARPEAIVEIEREMKLDEALIRYLVVRYDEMTEHEERAPRQQAEGPGGPGGPSFRRPRPEGQAASAEPDSAATDAPAATATAEAPADDVVPTEDATPLAEAETAPASEATDEAEAEEATEPETE